MATQGLLTDEEKAGIVGTGPLEALEECWELGAAEPGLGSVGAGADQ